jgi:hypothetical protein
MHQLADACISGWLLGVHCCLFHSKRGSMWVDSAGTWLTRLVLHCLAVG